MWRIQYSIDKITPFQLAPCLSYSHTSHSRFVESVNPRTLSLLFQEENYSFPDRLPCTVIIVWLMFSVRPVISGPSLPNCEPVTCFSLLTRMAAASKNTGFVRPHQSAADFLNDSAMKESD